MKYTEIKTDLSFEQQKEVLNIFFSEIEKELKNLSNYNYIPLSDHALGYSKAYDMFYGQGNDNGKIFLHSTRATFLFYAELYNFNQYKDFMETIEKSLSKYPNLSFAIKNSEEERFYLEISIGNIQQLFETDYFKSLSALKKFGI